MGLELPSELTEPLGWIGLTWPQADEEKLFQDGVRWIEFGQSLGGIRQQSDGAARTIVSIGEGGDDVAKAFEEWWTRAEGPSARMGDDAVAAQLIGAALIAFAAITLTMKLAFIAQLIALAIAVAQAIATAAVSFGATMAEVPGWIAAARTFCARLLRQIVEHVQTVIKELIQRARNLFKKFHPDKPPTYGPDFEKKMLDDVKKTNPNFDPPNPDYSANCVHCVQAYELRRRGYDVEATALPEKYRSSGGRPLSDIEHTWGRNFTDGSKSDIDNAFSEPGSRGIVYVQWKNGGGAHVFNVENVNGEVRYIDGQSGKMYVQGYFDQGTNTKYLRTDDLATPHDTSEYTTPS